MRPGFFSEGEAALIEPLQGGDCWRGLDGELRLGG
jgi:hypothetical protein